MSPGYEGTLGDSVNRTDVFGGLTRGDGGQGRVGAVGPRAARCG